MINIDKQDEVQHVPGKLPDRQSLQAPGECLAHDGSASSCAAHPAFLLDVFTADNAGRAC